MLTEFIVNLKSVPNASGTQSDVMKNRQSRAEINELKMDGILNSLASNWNVRDVRELPDDFDSKQLAANDVLAQKTPMLGRLVLTTNHPEELQASIQEVLASNSDVANDIVAVSKKPQGGALVAVWNSPTNGMAKG